MSQDVGRNFKRKTLRKLFPEKIIDDEKLRKKVDIGLICCEWLYLLLTVFEPTNVRLQMVIYLLIQAYGRGYNIENSPSFRKIITFYFTPTFSKKINKFSQIAKLSLMDDLDRSYKSRKINEGEDIQW